MGVSCLMRGAALSGGVEGQAGESRCLAVSGVLYWCWHSTGAVGGDWTETPPLPILLTDHTGRDTLGGWPSRWNHLNFTMSLRKEPGTYMF